jgi:hypothetical protein
MRARRKPAGAFHLNFLVPPITCVVLFDSFVFSCVELNRQSYKCILPLRNPLYFNAIAIRVRVLLQDESPIIAIGLDTEN